jgi:hypothetical protein
MHKLYLSNFTDDKIFKYNLKELCVFPEAECLLKNVVLPKFIKDHKNYAKYLDYDVSCIELCSPENIINITVNSIFDHYDVDNIYFVDLTHNQLLNTLINLLQSNYIIDELHGLPFTTKDLLADVSCSKDLLRYEDISNGKELINQRLDYIQNNYIY